MGLANGQQFTEPDTRLNLAIVKSECQTEETNFWLLKGKMKRTEAGADGHCWTEN